MGEPFLKELRGRDGRMRFCLPNRRQRRRSAASAGLALLLLAGGAVAGPLFATPFLALAAWFAFQGMRGIWRRHDVVLDPGAGRVWVSQRGVFSRKAWTAELRDYSCVLLDLWEDRPGASVTLYHPNGWNIQFGVAPSNSEAIDLAGRLSTFLRLPVQHPVVY